MQLRDSLRVLRHGWPLLALLLLVGAAAGGSVSFLQRPSYVATAKAYVFVSTATTVGDLANSTAYTQQVAASFADIAGTSYVLRPVINALSLDESTAQLAAAVSVTAVANESVLQISATDSSPSRAARIANAIATRLTTAVGSLTPQTNRTTAVKVTVIDPAVGTSSAVGLGLPLYLGLGALAGIVAGVLFLALREILDTRVRSVDDVAVVTDIPVLGSIPSDASLRRHPVALGEGVQGPLAETYRSLRTSLQFLQIDDAVRSMVVTSSIASEGKSVTAVNLAVALAEAGERVVLIDADLRRPTIAGLLGLDGAIGLTDVLIGQVDLDDALQMGDTEHLMVLPSGTVPPNPNELLQSNALRSLLSDLESRFDRVVIDAPPVLPVSDATILAHRASGAVLVAASGHVKRAQLAAALAAFEQTRATVLGVVLTMVPARESSAVTSGGYYRHAGEQVRAPLVRRAPSPTAVASSGGNVPDDTAVGRAEEPAPEITPTEDTADSLDADSPDAGEVEPEDTEFTKTAREDE